MTFRLRRVCSCGHAKDTHEHYRRGSDCSGCACATWHARLELVLHMGRRVRASVVVLPDSVPATEQPHVRWTHSAGLTQAPEVDLAPLLRHHISLPRDGAKPLPEPVHVVAQRQARG